MFKRVTPILICLMAASAAVAQPGGGHGRGGRPAVARPPPAVPSTFKPLEIVGVVKAIDPDAGRITIAYDTVEALNWPPGTQPFPVAKTALLSVVAVGEKILFSLDSGQISAIRAFDAP